MSNVNKETDLGATIVTVAYAATFAYGLTIWDTISIDKHISIVYLTFIYAFLITDWFNIYVRLQLPLYTKKNLFIFDILVIFLISRVMSTSVSTEIIMYWWFMFSVFLTYILWDIVVWRTKVWSESRTNWLSNLIGDSLAAVIILLFCIYVIPGECLSPCLTSAVLLVVCIVAVINWFKPFASCFAKKS